MGRHAFALDFVEPEPGFTKQLELPKPPGFAEQHAKDEDEKTITKKVDSMTQLKLKKAREMAWSPGKQFMMTGLMLWMSGSGVHIFSIMIVFYAVYNPLQGALGVNKAFVRFDDANYSSSDKAALMASKGIFVLMNMLAMTGALYKMNSMGLLPNTPSDWIAYLQVPPNLQMSSGS